MSLSKFRQNVANTLGVVVPDDIFFSCSAVCASAEFQARLEKIGRRSVSDACVIITFKRKGARLIEPGIHFYLTQEECATDMFKRTRKDPELEHAGFSLNGWLGQWYPEVENYAGLNGLQASLFMDEPYYRTAIVNPKTMWRVLEICADPQFTDRVVMVSAQN